MYSERYERMIRHLLWQFQEKSIIEGILYAIHGEFDELDTAQNDLKERRWIDTGDGIQLDNIGMLIDRQRVVSNAIQLPFFGFKYQNNALTFGKARFRNSGENYLSDTMLNDEEYRKVLWAKVFKNSSLSTAEDTIIIIKKIVNINRIILREVGNAKITISVSRILSDYEISLLKAINLFITEAGVGIRYISMYDTSKPFAFKNQDNAHGFGCGIFSKII